MRGLPPGWRIVDMAPDKVEKHLKEVARIAKELDAIPRIKKPRPDLSHLTDKEREEYYFNEQPESTKAAILAQRERKPEDDLAHLLRPMPDCDANESVKVARELWNKKDTLDSEGVAQLYASLDKGTGRRAIDPEDALREKALKTGRNQLGQSTSSSVDSDKKQRGVEAFTYSKPAELSDSEMWRIKSLNELDAIVAAEPAKPEPKKRPWWKFWAKDSEADGKSNSGWAELIERVKERNKK